LNKKKTEGFLEIIELSLADGGSNQGQPVKDSNRRRRLVGLKSAVRTIFTETPNMRLIATACLFCQLAFACGSAPTEHPAVTPQQEPAVAADATKSTTADSIVLIPARDITSGYFLRNDVQLKEPVQAFLITNQSAFDKLFGIAKTMNKQVPTINFDQERVIAVVYQRTDRPVALFPDGFQVFASNGEWQVRFSPRTNDNKESYLSSPIFLRAVPKGKDKVRVFAGDHEIKVSERQ